MFLTLDLRYKVRMEIIRKQKDTENKIPSSVVHPSSSDTITSNDHMLYNDNQKFKELEEKWKIAYERVVSENEHLRTRGGEAALIMQLREQYEVCLKEKNDLDEKLKLFEKLLQGTNNSQAQKTLEQSYLELREEYKVID